MATVEKLPGNRAKLTVTVDKDTFAAAVQQAYTKTAKRYKIPGFRPGRAPRKVIETMYGEGVFYEDAFELVWGEAYDKAVEENGITPVDRPTLDIEKIDKDEGAVFTAEVQLMPEVKLGKYKGIEIPEPTYTVEDADVERELQQELDKNSRFVDVERACQDGDRVVIDYAGTMDGQAFDDGSAEDQVLVLGSHTFIPGFEEQVAGMSVGEEKDIDVTFPEEYHAKHLAGKAAVFHIKLKQVQIKETPALDDEFAKDVSEFDTLEELRAHKRSQLTETAEKNRRTAIENAAVQAACEAAQIDIPDVRVDRQVNYMLQEMSYRLSMSGISLADYCQYLGTDVDKLRADYRPEALERVRMQLVIEAIGKEESVAVTDEELDAKIQEMAQRNKTDLEEFKKGLTDGDREYIRDRAVAEKTVELIVSSAVLTAPKAQEPEKQKKAPAKKKAAEKPEE